eukprot:7362685-Heterocapsa_arctica.AAC.1
MRKASLSGGLLALGLRKGAAGRWSAAARPSWASRAAQVPASEGVSVSLVQPKDLNHTLRSSEAAESMGRSAALRTSVQREEAPF